MSELKHRDIKGASKSDSDRAGPDSQTPNRLRVTIRLLEDFDSQEVMKLIKRLLFTEAGKSMAMEAMKSTRFIVADIMISIFVYFLFQSFWPANFWFVAWPAVGYYYIPAKLHEFEYDKGEDNKKGQFFKFWTQPGRLKLVAVVNEKILGTIGTVDLSDTHVAITRIATDPWIKKYNIRERLLRMVLVLSRDRGMKTLDFHTSYPKRHEAAFQELYESLGFKLDSFSYAGVIPYFKVKCYKYTYIFGGDEGSRMTTVDDMLTEK